MYLSQASADAYFAEQELLPLWKGGAALIAALMIWLAATGPGLQTEPISFGWTAGSADVRGWTQGPDRTYAPFATSRDADRTVAAPFDAGHSSPLSVSAGSWDEGFGFAYRGVSGSVHAMVRDEGGTVIVAGSFQYAGAVKAGNIARWDPQSRNWAPLGSGTNGIINALAIGLDGRVYAGGSFTDAGGVLAVGIAAWSQAAERWEPLPGHVNQAVYALLPLEDGRMAVGGAFSRVGPVDAAGVAIFDPATATWAAVGQDLTGTVFGLATSEDGALVAAGDLPSHTHLATFDTANGLWMQLGDGAPGPVRALMPVSGGLVIGGQFDAGPTPNESLMRWDDATGLLETLADGINGGVGTLFELSTGDVVAGGAFNRVGTMPVSGLALLETGTGEWLAPAAVNSRVNAILEDDEGRLLVGGSFTHADGMHADGLVYWDPMSGTTTPLVPDFEGAGTDGAVFDVATMGDRVVAGGVFTRVGRQQIGSIAEWNAVSRVWTPLGEGLDNLVKAVAFDADGGLYAGGYFSASGSRELRFVAHWDGSAWTPLGEGLNGAVEDIAIAPDGRVYVAGYFSTAGELTADGVAVWDPATSTWAAVGSGINAGVDAIGVGPDGKIYAGGSFTRADGAAAPGVAVFDPAVGRWQPMGLGKNSIVRTLAIGRDGTVYTGGLFTQAGSIRADYAAAWDPVTEEWSALVTGDLEGLDSVVRTIATAPDGTVILGGLFRHAGTTEASHVVSWDPQTGLWSALSEGVNDSVRGIAVAEDGAVVLGGFFTEAGGKPSSHIARWQGEQGEATAIAAADPTLPSGTRLDQNYPNPFNPETTIAFELASSGETRLAVYDLLGREVRLLASGQLLVGAHSVRFDASGLPSGSYIYRLDTKSGSTARTLTVLK